MRPDRGQFRGVLGTQPRWGAGRQDDRATTGPAIRRARSDSVGGRGAAGVPPFVRGAVSDLTRSNSMKIHSAVWSVVAVLSLAASGLRGQEAVSITGHVAAGGHPVQNATVQIRELGIGTTTNADGRFTFIVPSSKVRGQSVTLSARHVRFNPETYSIQLTGGTLVHDFELFPVGDSRSSSSREVAPSTGGPVARAE